MINFNITMKNLKIKEKVYSKIDYQTAYRGINLI